MISQPDITPVILAGGAGRRLWPLSHVKCPKPFIRLPGGLSLLQMTAQRVCGMKAPVIVCNAAQYGRVVDHMRQAEINPGLIVCEPLGRGTAPAVTAALSVSDDPDRLFLVMPSDHAIGSPESFLRAVERATPHARAGKIVMFGITPRHAATRFGYIGRGAEIGDGAHTTRLFFEKPEADLARSLVRGGDCLWNSGIFLFTAASWRDAIRTHCADIHDKARDAVAKARSDGKALFLDMESFAACPPLSVDRAVMEKTRQSVVVSADMGWSDLGTWPSLLAHIMRF